MTLIEVELERLIFQVIQLQKTSDEMEDRQWKLLRLIGKRLGITKATSRPS